MARTTRGAALGGSIALHVVAGALLIVLRAPETEVERPRAAAIEIVHGDQAMLVEIVELASGGGGSSGAAGASGGELGARNSARESGARELVAHAAPRARRESSTGSRFDNAGTVRALTDAPVSDSRTLADSLGQIATESRDHGDGDVGQGGDGGGQGGGHGHGRGRGIGLGDGAVIGEQPRVATPVAPRASRARPAKLIYPVRQGEVEDGKLFVARITVDTEGFVVGAKVVQGPGGPRGAEASGLIFRFRYSPALDDDGRPVRSTFDQDFLVER